MPKIRKCRIAVFKCWSVIFFLNQVFHVALSSWVISDNRRKDFLYVFADLTTGLMMSHCPLGCLLGWVWLWVVFLAVDIHRIVVWGGLLLGSSCTVVVRRVVGFLWWVRISVSFSYIRLLYLILQLGHGFLEWVVLYSCTSHFLWLEVVALLRFSTRCSNGVWFFAWWASRKSSW